MTKKKDWMLKDYTTADDATLKEAVGWQDELIKELRKSIDEAEEWRWKYQEELLRREIDAYFLSHPETLRLNTGDKVILTHEYINWYEKASQQFSRYKAGEVVTVARVKIANGKLECSTVEFGSATPYKLMLSMRQAYLDHEAAAHAYD